MGPVLADSHDRIRNLATNATALWLLESGISARRPAKNPYAIALDWDAADVAAAVSGALCWARRRPRLSAISLSRYRPSAHPVCQHHAYQHYAHHAGQRYAYHAYRHHAYPSYRHHAYHADPGEPGPERRNIDEEEEPSCNSVCL